MKKLILGIVIFFILALIALAADGVSVSESTITLEQGESETGTITVTNTGTTNLTGITFSVTQLVSTTNPSNTLPAPGFSPIDLNTGASANLQYTIDTDSDTPAETYVATLTTDYNATASVDSTITVNVEEMTSKLEITRVDVSVDQESDNNIQEGDRISEDAKPESRIIFEVTLLNDLPDDDDDNEIKDIEVTVTIKDIDDGDDIDKSAKEFDLDPQNDDDVVVAIELPLEVDEDTYDVIIEAKGKDGYRNRHEAVYEIRLDVNKKAHDISILNAAVIPEQAICDEEIRLPVEIINLGSSREEEVKIEITGIDLGINIVEENIELDDDPFDSGSKYSKTYIYELSEIEEGEYIIDVKVYFDEDILIDMQRLALNINCTTAETTTTTTLPIVTTTQPGDEQDNPDDNTNSTSTGTSKSKAKTILLIILDLVLMAAVIGGVIIFMMRKAEQDALKGIK